MALNTANLEAGILDLLDEMETKGTNENQSPEQQRTDAKQRFANGLSALIETYVKSGDIVVTGVITAGSATTQTQTNPITVKMV